MVASKKRTERYLLRKIESLERRLYEAEETLRAIHEGEVDAIVVTSSKGEQVFSLFGAESIYRLVVETMKEAAFTVTFDGKILYCNLQFSQFIKVPTEQIIGHALTEFVAGPDMESTSSMLSSVQNHSVKQRIVFQAADGSSVPAHISANILDQPDGVSICMVASDLTELENSTGLIEQLRHQQEALRESESRFKAVFFSSHDAILLADDRAVITEANPAAEKLLGAPFKDLIGASFEQYMCSKAHFDSAWSVFNKKGRYLGDQELIRSDGQMIYTEFAAAANVLPGRHLFVIHDISERKQAEEQTLGLLRKIQHEKERLSALIDSIQDEVWFADEHGKLTLVNRAVIEEFGESIANQKDTKEIAASFEVYRPDGTPRPVEEAPPLLALRGQPVSEEEIVRIPTTGELRYRHISASPVTNGEGRMIGSVSVVRDITERKRSEESLRQSEERFRMVFENSAVSLLISDINGHILSCNDAFLNLLGYSLEELKTIPFAEYTYPEDLSRELPFVEELIAGKRSHYTFEKRFIRKDGRVIWGDLVGTAVKDPKNNVLFGITIIQDITHRKQVEAELRRSRERLDWILERTGVGMWLNKLPLSDLTWDRNTRRLFFIPEEAVPTIDLFWSRIHPDDREQTRLSVEKAIQDGTLYEIDHRTVNPETSEVRWIHSAGHAIYDENGTPTLFDGLSYDISAPKRAEEALRESEARLRETNADLERKVQQRTAELVQRAAQLRALAGELTLTEHRERRRIAVGLHDQLQQILVAAKFRIAVLGRGLDDLSKLATKEVEDLLDDSIAASRSLTADLTSPILHDAGLVAGMQWLTRRMADKHGLIVDQVLEEVGDLPDDLKVLLFESLRELLFNVVKHAQTSLATMNLRRVGDAIQLTVSDQGIGFDPNATLQAIELGGGFGLFCIRERLELFGGTMKVASAAGQGTRIVLSVPMTKPLVLEQVSTVTPPAKGQTVQIPSAIPGKKSRVLLADDHKIVRQGIANLISNEPDIETVGEAGDGHEAIQLARVLLPDVILMDMSMPKLNGVEATRVIHKELPEIRIIGLSMYEQAERAQAMRDAGASDYVSKGGPAEELIASIRRSVRRSQSVLSLKNA